MKIFDGLYLIGSGQGGIGLTHELDCSVYLIDGGSRKAMVDAGAGVRPELIEKQMQIDGFSIEDIDYLLLTHGHADHAGGASYFRSKGNLRVFASKHEADYIRSANIKALGLDIAKKAGYYPDDFRLNPCPVDEELSDGDELLIGDVTLKVIETPGHSLGGICYFGCLGGKNVLFVGDLIAFGGFISLQNIPGVNLSAYSESVLKLEKLKVDALLTGHNLFTVTNGQSHIDKAAQAFKKLGVPPNVI